MMRANYCRLFLIVVLLIQCRRAYIPPEIAAPNSYLVVDGYIDGGSDSTIFKLTRTRNLENTREFIKETGALVMVNGSAGESYPLQESGSGGIYTANSLNLNITETYQLKIITATGGIYISDSVPVLTTPAIDSISWSQKQDGVHIYANTHDDSGNTKYYRWEYIETWEYHSSYFTDLIYVNGDVADRTMDEYIYTCWRTQPASTITLGTSAGLSQPIVSMADVQFIPANDSRISIGHSILVKQFAITQDAFAFWQNLLKNTENRGSLFDPQPSQTIGNIHCVNNPGEPVVGYISANSMTTKREFIFNEELANWSDSALPCPKFRVANNAADMAFYFDKDYYIPVERVYAFSVLTGFDSYLKDCVDCRENGGVTEKPLFWPR